MTSSSFAPAALASSLAASALVQGLSLPAISWLWREILVSASVLLESLTDTCLMLVTIGFFDDRGSALGLLVVSLPLMRVLASCIDITHYV